MNHPEQKYFLSYPILSAQTNTLREQGRFDIPEEVDPCIPLAYGTIWKQLLKSPEAFDNKPYGSQRVLLPSSPLRDNYLAPSVQDTDISALKQSLTLLTPQWIETWVTLQGMLTKGEGLTPELKYPLFIFALYRLIAEVKTHDIPKLSEYDIKTIIATKTQISSRYWELPLLRQKIPPLPPLLSEPPRPSSVEGVKEICPEPQVRESSEPLYQTRWKGSITFEELFTDRDIRRVAFSKMRRLGHTDLNADDCFQLGALNLWKRLQEQPHLLSDKGAAWVGVWIALSGSRRELWKHKARSISLDHREQKKTFDKGDDGIDNYLSGPPERRATFATRVDERIDFALLMSALAQSYESDPLKLFALYSLTTSVKMKDLLPVVKTHKNQFIRARHTVKSDLKAFLEQDREGDVEDEFWTNSDVEQHQCVGRVAEQVIDSPRLLLALYVTTTSAKRKDVMELFKLARTGFRKDIAKVKIMLTEEARRAKHY